MASIPPAFTLSGLSIGDTMNYGGQSYSITNVGAATDNNNGLVTYAVTLSNGKIVTVSAKNTIRSSVLNNGTRAWIQNATI